MNSNFPQDPVQEYINLLDRLDNMVRAGANDLNPTCRSIARKLGKLYRAARTDDRRAMDYISERDTACC